MKETVAYCDLDDKDARRPGVAVLSIEIDGTTHAVDVCQPHLTLLRRLPSAAARAGRGRPALKRAPAKKAPAKSAAAAVKATPAKKAPGRKAAVKKVAAKKVAAKKAPAKRTTTAAPGAAGRTPGSRRDQQQRVAAAREWARAQGRTIAGKGRLPAGLLEEFDAASS